MSLTTLALPENISFCRNNNEISITLATDLPLTTANLKIKCILFIEHDYGSGTFWPYVQLLDPDENGECKFFWHDIIEDIFEHQFDDLPSTTPVIAQHVVRNYKFLAVELSGDPQTSTDALISGSLTTQRQAVYGGIALEKFSERPFFGLTNWHGQELQKSFFDNMGATVRTFTDQMQFLPFWWHNYPGVGNYLACKVAVKMYKSDGTTQTIYPYSEPVNINQVIHFPVGFTQLALVGYETASVKVIKYEVWTYGTAAMGNVSQPNSSHIRTYHVRRDYQEFKRYLYYRNSLGTLSAFAICGRMIRDVNVKKEMALSYWEKGYNQFKGGTVNSYNQIIDRMEFATGTLTAAEERQLIDILQSDHLIVGAINGQKQLPVDIASLKISPTEDQNIKTFNIALMPKFNNQIADVMAVE